MKLATFIPPGGTSGLTGEVRGSRIVTFTNDLSLLDRLRDPDRAPATGPDYALSEVTLLEPIPRPPAIFCVGRNYAEHIAELGSARPDKPLIFLKLPLSSAAPNELVQAPKASQALDYEAELVLVMGDENRIIGYAVANDLSARDLQRSEKQWARAKAFDGSCPWGPWITTADELPDALGLRITTHVNNELRQDGNTRSMIFNPREIVDFIAEACTLEPGAIVLTGTPSGVGEAFDPPRYLQPGDIVRVEIEQLGVIEHSVL
jgi:acylpyruvate hydrolase